MMIQVVKLFILFILFDTLNCQFEDDQFDLDEGWFTDDKYNDPYFVALRNKNGLIFPGTKWCGEGTKAMNDTDFGTFIETDKCCRSHDFCPSIIKAGHKWQDLTNSDSSTRLSCKCDNEFYECLKKIQDVPSKTIGTIFFDVLKKKCFEKTFNGKYVWRSSKSYSSETFTNYIKQFNKTSFNDFDI
ncbi:phospholipase A2-like [Aphidius gifuensis]|uniref:phospholipase A2-like n=1 Tax=Aphidius gifuensis TaxID=684658 RepID=UPI001CDBC76E|nr:phospholipase A2-like [Aphidius gifuensis]